LKIRPAKIFYISVIIALLSLATFISVYGKPAPDIGSKLSSVFDILRWCEGDFYRASSGEVSGNRDFITIEPGKEAVILDVSGAGIVHRIWVTVLCADPSWPRMLVLEMFWDGEISPNVRVPLGDFFGAAMGKRIEFQSRMSAVSPYRGTGLNSMWPMPFAKGARIVVRNESSLPVQAFYYQIDYTRLDKPPPVNLRFKASYNQRVPDKLTHDGTLLEVARIQGEGCYAGCVIGINNQQGGWFGEGDEIIDVDGRILQGTGLEDMVGAAWRPATSAIGPFIGFLSTKKALDNWKGFFTLYKFYIEPPVCFSRYIKVSLERRPQDSYSAVAYWYQAGPGRELPELPAPRLREPPRSKEGVKALEETRRLFVKIYKLAGWPDNFIAFDSVGNLISRVDLLFDKEDYPAALRLLRAAARREPSP